MSEVLEADANLKEIARLRDELERAETEIKALRSLEQLDQALSALSVAEIDSARARIDSALVPQLAKMLALCLIKDDGEMYNVVTWELGSAEPLGTMELILQRTEGKTPTELRIEAEERAERAETARKAWTELGAQAEADAAALRAALLRCYDAWKPPVPDWLIEAATGQLGQQAMQEVSAALAERAELDAARAVVAAVRAAVGVDPAYSDLPVFMFTLKAALTEYDAATKARGE